MSFLISCNQSGPAAANLVTPALDPLIADFTYPDPNGRVRADNFSFGDRYNQPSGDSYAYPLAVVNVSTGGVDGTGGNGGSAGSSGSGGRGGTGGRGGAGGTAGRGGANGTGGAPLGPIGLVQDFTGGDWHVSGVMPGGYQGGAFAFNFVCITDASAFSGIQFTISGTAGILNQLTLEIGFSGDQMGSYTTPGTGSCAGACNAPRALVNLPATGTATIRLPWSRFVGGTPISALNPAQLTYMSWKFASTQAPYSVNVHLDDLIFYTDTPDAGAD
jgi:hypothetical protein